MNPATIIQQAGHDGVVLALSEKGNVRATGKQGAINRWHGIDGEHKRGIIATKRDDEPTFQ